MHYNTLFLSDIHLGNRLCHADSLLDFLKKVTFDRLYLVGDIVDMWAMKQRVYWPENHSEVLEYFHSLAKTGVDIKYIPGNHDMPMRNYANGLLLNVEIHQHCVHKTAQGKKLLVLHGDEFDHAVLYRKLNKYIGESAYGLMTALNRIVHKARSMFGLPYWSFANYLKQNIGQARKAIEDFEQAAIAEAKSRNLDGVVCGHIHLPKLRLEDDILYCNDGDWTESCSALAEDVNGNMVLLDWGLIQTIIRSAENESPLLSAA